MRSVGLTWDHLATVRGWSSLPLVLKGILTAEDARLAVEHGAAAVWVSNHGGRQLDRVAAPIDVLAEIVEAVDGRAEVYLDGGVRRGPDVAIALARAPAQCSPRMFLYALGCAGEQASPTPSAIVREETLRTSRCSACASPAEISGRTSSGRELDPTGGRHPIEHVRRSRWPSGSHGWSKSSAGSCRMPSRSITCWERTLVGDRERHDLGPSARGPRTRTPRTPARPLGRVAVSPRIASEPPADLGRRREARLEATTSRPMNPTNGRHPPTRPPSGPSRRSRSERTCRLGIARPTVQPPLEVLHHLGVGGQRRVWVAILRAPTAEAESLGSEDDGRHRHMMRQASYPLPDDDRAARRPGAGRRGRRAGDGRRGRPPRRARRAGRAREPTRTTSRTRRSSPTPSTTSCSASWSRSRAPFPQLVTPDSPTQRVGGAPTGTPFDEVRHRRPMLSLGTRSAHDELRAFDARVRRGLGLPPPPSPPTCCGTSPSSRSTASRSRCATSAAASSRARRAATARPART